MQRRAKDKILMIVLIYQRKKEERKDEIQICPF